MERIQIVNELTISIKDEDHTLINPLKHMITTYNNKDIDFCGYTIPHPTEQKVNLVVQFKDEEAQNIENVTNKIEQGIDNFKAVLLKILHEIDSV